MARLPDELTDIERSIRSHVGVAGYKDFLFRGIELDFYGKPICVFVHVGGQRLPIPLDRYMESVISQV